MKIGTFSMLASALAMAPVLTVPAMAQDDTQPEIFCWRFYPDATYEELIHLCQGDTPPGDMNGGSGGYYYFNNVWYLYPLATGWEQTYGPGGGPHPQ